MLFVSIFTSERARDPELLATIWQGEPPPSINIVGAHNLGNDRRVFIWEGESKLDFEFMDRFNDIGVLDTFPALDRTNGWQKAFAKDIEGFKSFYESTGRPNADSAIYLRTRGMNAPTRQAARAEALRWQEEQATLGEEE